MSVRQFGMEDPVRHLGWLVLCGVKVAEPLDQQRAALVYLRELIDRRLQELGEEMGQTSFAEEATIRVPPASPKPKGKEERPDVLEELLSPPPSKTGEQEGHVRFAEEANFFVPPASPASLDDEGPSGIASNGQAQCAPSSTPNKVGEGQTGLARKSPNRLAPPALVPTAAQRAAAAKGMAVAAVATAKTILDTLMVRGNIAIGDVRYTALEVIQAANEWEAAFVQEIRNCGIPPNPGLRVRDYLTAKQVEEARRNADRRFHNVA